MTDQQHPITPPPELVRQWDEECDSGHNPEIDNTFDALKCFASKAARWGADAELEAILALAGREIPEQDRYFDGFTAASIRRDRRPKPPSLKEQALAVLDHTPKGWGLAEVDLDIIRRALEQLDD